MQQISLFFKTHRVEALLFLVSFVVHFAASIFLYAKFGNRVFYFENEDAIGYMELGAHVAVGDGFIADGVPSAVRTPVYPILLSLVFLSHLPVVWTVMIMQNILASLAGVLLYAMGKRLFSPFVGTLAGTMYILEPYMIMTANLATTETLYNFLLIAFVYLLYRFLAEEKKKFLIGSAVLFGLVVLTRPVALYMPGIVFILFAIRFLLQKKNVRLFAASVLIFSAVGALIALPWIVREEIQFGRARITNIDANMMYFRIAPIVVSHQKHIGYIQAIAVLRDRMLARFPDYTLTASYGFRYYDFMTSETKKLVASDPFAVARFYALSLIPGLTGTGYEYMLEAIGGLQRTTPRVSFTELLLKKDWRAYIRAVTDINIFQITLLFSALLWVAAYVIIFFGMFRKETWKKFALPHLLLLLFAGYCTFFSLGPQIHARYRMPSLPFLYLLFAYAIWRLREGRRTKHP